MLIRNTRDDSPSRYRETPARAEVRSSAIPFAVCLLNSVLPQFSNLKSLNLKFISPAQPDSSSNTIPQPLPATSTATVSAWTSRPGYLILRGVGDRLIIALWLGASRSDPASHNLVALSCACGQTNLRPNDPSLTLHQFTASHKV